jgi:hypothetical protein
VIDSPSSGVPVEVCDFATVSAGDLVIGVVTVFESTDVIGDPP